MGLGDVTDPALVAFATSRGVGVVSASPTGVLGYLSAAAAALGGPGQLVAACCRRSAEASQSPR